MYSGDSGIYTLKYVQCFLARAVCGDELKVNARDVCLCFRDHDWETGFNGNGIKEMRRSLKDLVRVLQCEEDHRRFRARRRLDIGLRYGEAFQRKIAAIDGVHRATLAGSARRRKDTIGDLDVVVAVDEDDHETVANAILNLSGIADVKGAGDSKISLILDTTIFDESFTVGHIDPNVLDAIGGDDYEQLEAGGTIDAQVRLVPPHVEPFTLAYFTGSKEHNIAMRQRAIDRGLRLNEFGLIPEAKAGDLKGMAAAVHSLTAADEAAIYAHLDLAYVPQARSK